MDDAGPKSVAAKGPELLRVLLIINFILLVALIGPGSSRQLYLAGKRMGIADSITHFLQVWFIGSTILATILFVRKLVSKSVILKPTKLDWGLFLGWWSIVACLCAFAFMMGMGG